MEPAVTEPEPMLILVNESAGRAAPAIEAIERGTSGRDRRLVRCDSAETMRAELERAADEKRERIVIAGGDGTVSGAARIMRELKAPGALAVIPAGTGNDLARSLGVPMDLDEALTLALGGDELMIDGMEVEGAEPSLCVNAITVRRRNPEDDQDENETVKDWLGRASYWLTALSNVATTEPFRLRVKTPSVDTEISAHGFGLCNGRTAGGGTVLAPEADLDDGRFDLVLFPDQPLSSGLVTAFSVAVGIEAGELVRSKETEATLEADVDMLASIDGEITTTRRLSVRVRPGAFRFVVGPEAAVRQKE